MSLYWLVAGAWAAAGWPYLAFGFLVGSIPFGLVVSRLFFRRDLRESGSGNIGAANALRTLGRKAGVAVLLLDAFKGVVAVAAAGWLWFHIPIGMQFRGTIVDVIYPPPVRPLMPLAGAAAVLGHCYTPWLRLRGGKGVATFLGATLVLSGPAALAFCVAWLDARRGRGGRLDRRLRPLRRERLHLRRIVSGRRDLEAPREPRAPFARGRKPHGLAQKMNFPTPRRT